MLILAWKDLYLNRGLFLLSFGIMGGVYILALVTGDETLAFYARTVLNTYGLLLVPFFAFACAETEEKYRTLGFLRTLPVPPRIIVGAAYLAVLIHGILVVLALTALARLVASLPPGGVQAAVYPNILAAALTLPVAGLVLAVSYRTGLREARMALLSAFALLYLAPLVLAGKKGFLSFMAALTGGASAQPGQTALVLLFSFLLYTAEYAVGAWFFARRELS